MSDPSALLDRFVAKAGQLYSLPAIAMKVLELTGDPQLDTRALKECVENDPALTTKILRVVNSSLFGLSREVSDLSQALALLGTKPLRLLVLGFSLPEGLFNGVTADVLSRYWRHTLTKAVAAREIAETLWHRPGDDAFVAGLLQDLGMMLLIQQVGEPYLRFLARVEACQEDLIALEAKTIGFDHTRLTARLLVHWGLPSVLAGSVAWEDVYREIESPSDSTVVLPQILHLAEMVSCLLEGGQPELLGQLLDTGRRYRDLSQAQLDALIASLQEKVGQLADVLRLNLPQGLDYREVLARAHQQLAQVAAEAAADLIDQAAREPRPDPLRQRLLDEMQLLSEAIGRTASRRARKPAAAVAAGNPHAQAALAQVMDPPAQDRSPRDEQLDPGLEGHVAAAIAACRQSRVPLSLLLVELGNVDQMVLTRGLEGLEDLRRLLDGACRSIDHICAVCCPFREVGFAVILPNCDRQTAARLGHQLLAAIGRDGPPRPKAPSRGPEVDVGVAAVSVPPKNFTPKDLL